MTRLLRLSGIVLLILIACGALYAAQLVVKTKRYNAEAAAFTSEAVTAMASNWAPDELVRRAAPEWLSPEDLANLPAMFSHFSGLGRLRTLHPPRGRVGNGVFPGTRIDGTWADYAVTGDFDAGPTTFRMVLKRAGDGWQIAAFDVTSDAPARGK